MKNAKIAILIVAILVSACTLVIKDGAITISNATPVPTGTLVRVPTATPQPQRIITVMARTNVREAASVDSMITGVISTQTNVVSTSQVSVGVYTWYRISNGWVRSDRVSSSYIPTPTPTATVPSPTPSPYPTPTQEIAPALIVPMNGLNGYTQPSLNTARIDLRLMPNTAYRIIGINSEFVPPNDARYWYLICTEFYDGDTDICKDVFWVWQ